ncbi:MAG: hypothetical protein ACI8PT_000762 [Gammaproteobacteria bacterium]|jgi:hypothetical protein
MRTVRALWHRLKTFSSADSASENALKDWGQRSVDFQEPVIEPTGPRNVLGLESIIEMTEIVAHVRIAGYRLSMPKSDLGAIGRLIIRTKAMYQMLPC